MTNTMQSPRRNRDEEILTAAIQVFSEKGYAAASLQDVADAVGLPKGSLYHYISSKESLLYRIFQESHEEASALMAAIDALGLAPDAKLREFVRQLTLFYEQHRERASLYFSEWRHLTGDDRETVMKQRREFELYMRTMVSEAHERGLTNPDLDVKLATRYILTAVNGVILWYRPEGPLPGDDIADQIAELACSSVLRRKRPASAKAKPTT
jgi:TetR/AcrR family transcriptional regulator, cholesterol catabolism regulator